MESDIFKYFESGNTKQKNESYKGKVRFQMMLYNPEQITPTLVLPETPELFVLLWFWIFF